VNETSQLGRFHQAAKSLPEEAQQNIRILRNWAKSRDYQMVPNPKGGPEKWGEIVDGKFKPRLIIKPEASLRSGIHPISTMPRFEARIGSGANDWINSFTGQIGNSSIGEHIWLEHPYLNYEQQMEYLNRFNPSRRIGGP